jgi:hypothetical protein
MKKTILPALLIFLAFSGNVIAQPPSEQLGWSKADRTDFVTSCIGTAKAGMSEDSAKHYCLCMLEKIESKFPNPADAGKLTAEQLASPEWKKIIQNCLTGQWTTDERSEFVTSCVNAAKEGIGEEKAKKYCDCMLYKVEKKYPNAADAAKLTAQELEKPEWKKALQECLLQ